MDLSRFVGLPWREKGRGPDGYDCWGLVLAVYRKCLGIALPSFTEAYVTSADRKAIADLIAGHKDGWREIEAHEARALDAVLMTEAGAPRHIGLVACPGYVLHMVPGREAVIEPYTTGKLRPRIAGFFRYEAAP